jgi:hypothetical protein
VTPTVFGPAATSGSTDSYRCALDVSRQAGQVVGVAGHGLVQPAEGLLDAGVEVASTLRAVLA